jgi:hypothetical protein
VSRDRQRLRSALARPTYLFVRVAPEGFLLEHEERDEIAGRIVKSHLVRKRFEDAVLACDSKDGVTARDGTGCDVCLHPRCLALVRIHVREGPVIYVLDLAPTAARALLDLTDTLEAEGLRLESVRVSLTVENPGRWGLVRIDRV